MNSDDIVENFERHGLVEVAKHQAIVKRLQGINVRIEGYEEQFHGTFQDLFGHLTDFEIEAMSECADITDWKKLVEARTQLIEELDKDDIPSGVYAVHPDPAKGKVQVRRLYEYCRERGLSPSDLPPEIMKQFLVYPDKDAAEDEREE